MMNMYSGLMPGGMWLLHILFSLVFLIGLSLFLVWLVQFLLKKKQLLAWSIILLIIGVLGLILTFQGHGYGNRFGLTGMYEHMLNDDHDEFNTPKEFREHMIEEMREHMDYE